MPFCPKCRSEYREGAEECSICQVPLVDELEPEGSPETTLIELYRAPDEVTAVLVRGTPRGGRDPGSDSVVLEFRLRWGV